MKSANMISRIAKKFAVSVVVFVSTLYAIGETDSDSPSRGKGGGAEVLHVRAGATGDGSGSDWFNARTEFPATADDIPSTAKEIWVATDVRLGAAVFLKNDVALHGGFAGVECSLDERQPGVRTRIDASDRDYGVQISQGFNHLVFEGFEIVGAKQKGFYSNSQTVKNLEIHNCRFFGNGAEQTATVYAEGGRAIYIYSASPAYGFRLTCSNCVFDGNVATANKGNYMGKAAVYLAGIQQVNLADCLFVTNGVAWSQPIGKRPNTDLQYANGGAALMVENSSVSMTRCAFVGNRVLASPGYASAGYPCPIVMIKNTIGAAYKAQFTWTCGITNCLFVGNEGTMAAANTSGCDTGALAIYDVQNVSTAEVANCTFAYNIFNTQAGSAALSLTGGKLKIRNSIFYGNRLMDADQIRGADLRIRNQADAKADVDWSLFTSSGEESLYAEAVGALNKGDNLQYGDPKFMTTLADFNALVKTLKVDALDTLAFEPDDETLKAVLALDVHVADALSPAIDTGDDSPYENEPEPNGSRINLGAYGNTSEAHVSPEAVQPEIVAGSLAVTFPYETTQPKVAFKLGGPDGAQYLATATVLWSTNGTDWAVAKVIGSLGNGAEVDELMGFCVATGSPLQIKVSVSCTGAETREGVKAFDSVDYPCPPSWGKGGGAEVLHVRAGATGDGSGNDWFNARTEFPATDADIPSTAKEIWVATDVRLGASVFLKNDVALCGGFGGFECSRAERQLDVLTRIDASDRDYGVQISQNFKHLVFDGFEIVGAKLKGFYSSGVTVNNLEILNCRFVGNGTEQTASVYSDGGRALHVYGASPTYGYRLTCSNCVFAGNVAAADKGPYMGDVAVCLTAIQHANLTDCLFVTNGVAWSQPIGKRSDLTTANAGAALMVNNSSVAMTRCAFVGNRVLASPGYASAGYPCPIVMIKNTIGASPTYTWTCGITNCLFVGNEGTMAVANTSGCDTGALAIYDGTSASTAEVVNCTFAYNLFNTRSGSAALSLTGGKLKIWNSIFYGNRLMDADQIRGADLRIRNQADAKAVVDWSLFTSSGEESLYAEDAAALEVREHVKWGNPKFLTRLPAFDALVKTVKVDALDTLAFEPDDETLKAVLALDVHIGVGSPALDAGDPTSDYSHERRPNGERINLGAYGNTSEARQTFGLTLIVR